MDLEAESGLRGKENQWHFEGGEEGVMINFLCQTDWAHGAQLLGQALSWSQNIHRHTVRVFPDEINI